MNIIDELVRFSLDNIRILGPVHGVAYVKRCLPLWAEHYGAKVADQVRAKIWMNRDNGELE